jgi:mannose-6-phosphate isomerase-like protein (cupin superfamily)
MRRGGIKIDVRNANVEPVIEHDGTCYSYFLIGKGEMRTEPESAALQCISEFELKGSLAPHSHDTDEFYYLLKGEAIVQVADEQRRVRPGDLVHIPRNAPHSIWPANPGDSFRAMAIGVSYDEAGDSVCVDAELPEPRIKA